MLGLKGNNVKLTTKPSSQTKGKQGFTNLNMSSPYYQERAVVPVPARRIQSATNSRNAHPTKPKTKTIYRKQSEPIICTTESIYSHRITTIESRTASSSIGSFHGKRSPSYSEGINDGGGDTGWNRVRPLSASSSSLSNNSDVFHPIPFSTGTGFEIPTTGTDFEPVHPDENLRKRGKEDEILLSESDNLLQDVVSLCDEIGLESSLIDNLRNRRKSSHGSSSDICLDKIRMDQVLSSTNYKESAGDSVSENVVQETRANSATSELITHGNENYGNNYSAEQCTSSPVKVQNEAISRIISTLRLIEEEEKKGCEMAAHFGDFFRQKLSPPTSSRPVSLSSARQLQDKCCGGDYNLTPRFQKDTTPRLPPIRAPSSPTVQSARSCFDDDHLSEYRHSPRIPSLIQTENYSMSKSAGHRIVPVESTDETARNIFSFLDEVEKSDRDVLFNLKFDSQQSRGGPQSGRCSRIGTFTGIVSNDFPAPTMDTLIRKGSVQLAKEVILLERKIEEITQNITILEETLMSQRELNVRNIKNSQRDLKKRLKIQQEEFELAFSRHQAFVDQIIAEKRGLQDKCEKVLKESKQSEQRYQEHVKSLQDKHLDELKRIRKLQDNAEKTRKQKWVGTKTQEIRDMTVKGLEPEVQRIIQRHQQEMSEMRAWHADELRETEERYSRKQTMRLQELRESFNREKDEACHRERELAQKRYDSDLSRLNDEFESHKRRLIQEMHDERERFNLDESKLKELMQENVRKAQIKGEVEIENLSQEYATKIANLEKRHESELKSLKDVYESQQDNLVSNNSKKFEVLMTERESALQEQFHVEREKAVKEREKKLKDEFQKIRLEEEQAQDARIKRMQDKFQFELAEFEKSEMELKQKFSQVKSEVLAKEEMVFSLKTTLGLKEKQITELNESNMKMMEDRMNLTSVIRREFTAQIEGLEDECRQVKSAVLELKAKQKLDLETHQMEVEKVRGEKDIELEKIGVRVKHALLRKEEAIQEFQKQLEKAQIRISHLEQLLEQQRKDFVSSITASEPANHPTKKKVI